MKRSSASTWLRLRLGEREIDLFEGEHVAGRSADCAISLDDPAASRVHAIFVVKHGRATVQDLGSRHGVLVNGRPRRGARALAEGDTITLGDSSLRVVRVGSVPPSLRPPSVVPVGDAVVSAQRVATTLSLSSPGSKHRIEAYRVLAEAAKARAAEGRAEDAEAVLARPLAEVLSTLRGGLPVEHELVAFAALRAIELARTLRKPYWIDFVFDLFSAFGAIMPLQILERLDSALDDVSNVDRTAVGAYVTTLRGARPADEGEQALRDRVERLARRIDAARK